MTNKLFIAIKAVMEDRKLSFGKLIRYIEFWYPGDIWHATDEQITEILEDFLNSTHFK